MRRAQVRIAAAATTLVLFAGSWVAIARWGDRSASVPSAADTTTPATPAVSTDREADSFFEDDEAEPPTGSATSDSVAPVQAPIPTTQS